MHQTIIWCNSNAEKRSLCPFLVFSCENCADSARPLPSCRADPARLLRTVAAAVALIGAENRSAYRMHTHCIPYQYHIGETKTPGGDPVERLFCCCVAAIRRELENFASANLYFTEPLRRSGSSRCRRSPRSRARSGCRRFSVQVVQHCGYLFFPRPFLGGLAGELPLLLCVFTSKVNARGRARRSLV